MFANENETMMNSTRSWIDERLEIGIARCVLNDEQARDKNRSLLPSSALSHLQMLVVMMSQEVRSVLSKWWDSSERCSHPSSLSLDWVVWVVSEFQRWEECRRACFDTVESPRDVRRSVGICGSWSTLHQWVRWSCCVFLSFVRFVFDCWLKRRRRGTVSVLIDESSSLYRWMGQRAKDFAGASRNRVWNGNLRRAYHRRGQQKIDFVCSVAAKINRLFDQHSSASPKYLGFTYIPSVWKWLFQIDDATKDDREHSSEVLLLIGSNGHLDETFGHSHTFVEVRCFQNRSFAPEAELNRAWSLSTTVDTSPAEDEPLCRGISCSSASCTGWAIDRAVLGRWSLESRSNRSAWSGRIALSYHTKKDIDRCWEWVEEGHTVRTMKTSRSSIWSRSSLIISGLWFFFAGSW